MSENAISSLVIKPEGLGACLSMNLLTVPRYQRAFAWEEEHVVNFLTDITTAYANKEGEYFMGSVVLQGTNQTYEVVDGQQRLTMASILIAATRDFMVSRGKDEVAGSLESTYLSTKDIWSQQTKSKLTLSVYDNEFFRAAILSNDHIAAKRESHERIKMAKAMSLEHLEGLAKIHSDWFDRIAGLIKYLDHQARVIQVIVPSHANAYVIFETLNDRGADLSASDLLKNHLFGRAGDRVEEVQANWNQMLGILEAHGGDNLVITYIRQLWSATREIAREKELFTRIREKIVNPQDAVNFAAELVDRANHYSALLNPAHPLWLEHETAAKAIIESLNTIKVERFRPAMLALLANFSGKELTATMRYILNGSVRYLIAIGAGGGTLENAWSEVARKVTSKEIKTAAEFAKAMQRIVPNDEVFRAGFQATRISKGFLARYLLHSLERFARGENDCELIPNTNVAEVNLEHVLPENFSEHWNEIDPEVAAAYSRRLGNQVLLHSKRNSELGNQAFAQKRAVLAASDFVTTKSVGSLATWGPEEIEARQTELTAMALQVWSYKLA